MGPSVGNASSAELVALGVGVEVSDASSVAEQPAVTNASATKGAMNDARFKREGPSPERHGETLNTVAPQNPDTFFQGPLDLGSPHNTHSVVPANDIPARAKLQELDSEGVCTQLKSSQLRDDSSYRFTDLVDRFLVATTAMLIGDAQWITDGARPE